MNKIGLYDKCKISVKVLDAFILCAATVLALLIIISVLVYSRIFCRRFSVREFFDRVIRAAFKTSDAFIYYVFNDTFISPRRSEKTGPTYVEPVF